MSEKNRVEIHDFKDWKAGVYLIEAGCGQGKNYFVFNTLFPYAHENGKRMLVFSNRVALREQQQAQTQEKDVKLITYQSLEHDEYLETMQDTKNKVRGLMQQVSEYDYIVLDEAHYLYQDAPFNKNTETIIDPAYYKILSDCEFYESIVSKGTSFHKEVENRLGRKAVWYERKKKNEELSSYLSKNIGRRYEKDEREELVRIIDYRKDGHCQRKIEKLNHYLTRNQIGFILKSIFENRKTYWIIECAKNERTSY